MSSERKLSRRQFVGRAAASVALPAIIPTFLARPGHAASRAPAPVMEPTLATLVTDVKYGDSAARAAAVRESVLIGTPALAPLAEIWRGPDSVSAHTACEAIRRIIQHARRPGAEAEAAAARAHLSRLPCADLVRLLTRT